MPSIRRITPPEGSHLLPCTGCGAVGSAWDRLDGRGVCPDCQESLILGESQPVTLRTVLGSCAICLDRRVVPYVTMPRHGNLAIAVDLCPLHFRHLLGRRLTRLEFRQLHRALGAVGLVPGMLFLTHDGFYDAKGRAIDPVEVWG